jgi:hypothetical protein
MRVFLSVVACSALVLSGACQAAGQDHLIVVVGAPGTDEYGKMFAEWRERIVAAGKLGKAAVDVVGGETASDTPDRKKLQDALSESGDARQLWLILIGHGTFDGKTARFNLRGPDVSAAELAEWLAAVPCPVAIIDCSSSSGPFIEKLSGEHRIIVTAAKNGFEQNFARFGDYFSRALTEPQADLDKDDQVSLLEAFLFASRRVEEFYTDENRLATEHALLDDNGDGLGTAADWFQGVRVVKHAKDAKQSPDGKLANQVHLVLSAQERQLSPEARARRDELEQQLLALAKRKDAMPVDEYYAAVETIALELAHIYRPD